jgi:hypothetical protein
MLTIAELKDLIADLPDNMPVVIGDNNDGHMHATSIDADSWVYQDNIDERYFCVYGDIEPELKVQVAVVW